MDSAESPCFQILLAEDNPADVMLVRMALREARLNFELRVLEDGEQAMAFLESLDAGPHSLCAIDLLLLDMHLPKYDGEEILKRLRSSERFAGTPVIVMTGSRTGGEDDAQAPAVIYFHKPPVLDEFMQLGAIVRDLLHGKKPPEKEPGPPAAKARGVA